MCRVRWRRASGQPQPSRSPCLGGLLGLAHSSSCSVIRCAQGPACTDWRIPVIQEPPTRDAGAGPWRQLCRRRHSRWRGLCLIGAVCHLLALPDITAALTSSWPPVTSPGVLLPPRRLDQMYSLSAQSPRHARLRKDCSCSVPAASSTEPSPDRPSQPKPARLAALILYPWLP